MKIKFETLLQNCVNEFTSQFNDFTNPKTVQAMALAHLYSLIKGTSIDWRLQHKEIKEKVVNLIWSVDVRAVETLREPFPNAFPSWIKKGGYICEYDGDGDWALVKK